MTTCAVRYFLLQKIYQFCTSLLQCAVACCNIKYQCFYFVQKILCFQQVKSILRLYFTFYICDLWNAENFAVLLIKCGTTVIMSQSASYFSSGKFSVTLQSNVGLRYYEECYESHPIRLEKLPCGCWCESGVWLIVKEQIGLYCFSKLDKSGQQHCSGIIGCFQSVENFD